MSEYDVTKSKCWTCKFGVCVQENDKETFVHPGVMEENDHNIFGEDDEEHHHPKMEQHTVEKQSVKTVCFWRPEDITDSPPLLMAFVKQCNRYQKQ